MTSKSEINDEILADIHRHCHCSGLCISTLAAEKKSMTYVPKVK